MNNKIIRILDIGIFSFLILFAASLTNSIFINQLGYFGALILLLMKYVITKKNPFNRNGLETAFIILIIAQIISTILSVNFSQSLNNFLKFFLLIPTVYSVNAGTDDHKKAKTIFYVYLGFASISSIIYLINSYEYFIFNQYQLKQSGPSVFQYPITASELMSFTVIIVFTFMINEKSNIKSKLFYFLLFLISTLALLATYKRTGWLGTGAGIFIVLLFLKKWKIIVPLLLAFAIFALTESKISEIHIYKYEKNNLLKKDRISTDGRVYDIDALMNNIIVSDYENGILEIIPDEGTRKIIDLPSAVSQSLIIDSNTILSVLNDSRIFINSRSDLDSQFTSKKSAMSPGFLKSVLFYENNLYALDSDSGLTIFNNILNSNNKIRYNSIYKYDKINIDSNYFIFHSSSSGLLVFENINNLPDTTKKLIENKNMTGDFLTYNKDNLFFNEEGNFINYEIDNGKLNKREYPGIHNIYKALWSNDTLFLLSYDKLLLKLIPDGDSNFKLDSKLSLDFIPTNFIINNNEFYLAMLKESRLQSIFDPHNPSNFTRFALWRAGWTIFKDYPFFGVGNIDLAKLYIKYKRDFDKEIQGHMHNNYVHLLVILGIFGFLASIYLFIKIFLILLQIFNNTKGKKFISSFSIASIGCYVSFLVAGFTEWNFGDHEIITMLWFTIGLNFAFYNNAIKD